MSRLRDERGITLIEVLVAMTISVILLGATMSVVITMARGATANDRQNDAQQTARVTLDTLARQLRNLASPTSLTATPDVASQPRSIERDLPSDVIFKDVDQVQPAGSANKPNVRRVRYCVDATRGRLYQQIQTWITATDPAMPADTACPGTGWTATKVVAQHVTNGARAVFTYSGDAGAITATDSSSRADISRLTATLYVDADTTQRPAETQLVTSVFLRNQNREPVAVLKPPVILNPTTRTIQLNGSDSRDPEGQALTYKWFMDGTQLSVTGVLVQYNVPAGVHTFQLKVFDPANLEGDSATYTPFTS
jgi:prepilin-type N-terminal cleavage/methylation domain-containing protein